MAEVGVVRRKTTRTVGGTVKTYEIVRLVISFYQHETQREITGEEYDSFLDLRNNEEGEIRTGAKAPTVLVNGRERYSTYERRVFD